MISKIHSATIIVDDQDQAIDFFVNTLGWKKSIDNQMGPEMRFVSVAPPGGEMELALGLASWFEDGSGPGKGRTGISMVADDIDATYQALTERGVTFKEPVAMMPWGQKATWFSDPFGNEFFLVGE